MDRFLDNAARILDGGRSALAAGLVEPAWTVLMNASGGVRMIANSDWALEALARESGSELAYRVTVAQGKVSVNGWAGERRCQLEAESPAKRFRVLLCAGGRAVIPVGASS